MKKNISIIFLLLVVHSFCMAGNIVTGTVTVDGKEINAEYTLVGSEAWLGSGRNASIPHYSAGQVVVPATITVSGTTYNVTKVSDMAFRFCNSITSVTLPEGVTRIGNYAFKGCHDLVKVTLPSTMTTIGSGAFIDLPNLTDVIVKATTPPTWEYNDVFLFHEGGIGGDAKSIGNISLYVPDTEVSKYQSSLFSNTDLGWTTPDGWGSFTNIGLADHYEGISYVVYADNMLTFYHDGRYEQRTGVKYLLTEEDSEIPWFNLQDYQNKIQKVVFTPSFSYARPKDTSRWFYGCNSLSEIEGMQYLNTSETTNMSEMFRGCVALTSLDVSHLATSKCTDFSQMFKMCSKLQTLDLSAFDTSQATSMKEMFSNCNHLESLNLANFNTSKVTSFEGMFYYCERLETLHVESFDASANDGKGTSMFEGCQKLKTIIIPTTITNANNMLSGCSSMEDVYYYGIDPYTNWIDNTSMLAPNKATRFHVLSSQLNAWTGAYPNANCTFVNDLGSEAAPLLLYTNSDWNNLATLVTQGVANTNAKMMADITCDKDIVVGYSEEHPFSGTFDGNGHTLTMRILDDTHEEPMAPFCYVGNANFKNLVIGGAISGGIHSAGLVAYALNNSTVNIENCLVKAYISSRPNSTNGPHVGGFVGHGRTATINIKGCAFEGRLGTGFNYDDSYAGAFIGWCTSSEGKTLTDCYENGIYSGIYKHKGMNYDETGSAFSMTNCYHSQSWSEAKHAYSVTCNTEGLNIEFGDIVTTYDVSGINAYAVGLEVDSVFYAGAGDTVSFSFNNPGYRISNVKANDTTPQAHSNSLDGSDATYTFTLEATNYVITANMTFQHILLEDDATNNRDILMEHFDEEKTTNVKLKGRTLYMNGKWNTLCLPFELTEELLAANLSPGYHLKVLESASFSNGTLIINFKDTTAVAAGQPFIIKWDPAISANLLNIVFSGVTISSTTPGAAKFELGNSSRGLRFQGVFDRLDIEGEDHSKLIVGDSNDLFYPNGEMAINAFRAYFELYGIEIEGGANDDMGDVNGDGSVTVSDVTMMVDYILGGETDGFIVDNADINGDGTISVSDVTLTVDIILGNKPINVVTNIDCPDLIYVGGGHGSASVGESSIWANEN